MSKIFAGGNHSWVTVDENMPIREHYREPSPLNTVFSHENINSSKLQELMENWTFLKRAHLKFCVRVLPSKITIRKYWSKITGNVKL